MSDPLVIITGMWIASQYGFFSIVRKDEDVFFIRARVRQDLENLLGMACLKDEEDGIRVWPQADYRYRIIVDLEVLLEIFIQLAVGIDYPNFKARVYEREDQVAKLGPYQRIWSLMSELQEKEEVSTES